MGDHEDHEDHGEGCGKAMDAPDSKTKMGEVCAAGGPIDKFKKGCPAEDFNMIMEMSEGGHDDRRRLDGPPECVSACDGDICCDGGICPDCSTSSCSPDDMAIINAECARQGSGGGSGSGSGSGSGGMMMMPKT